MAGRARRRARRLLLQAFYQMQISGHSAAELQSHFAADAAAKNVDTEYFADLLITVCENQSSINSDIDAFGDISSAKLDPVERGILWLAIGELRHQPDVPTNVIINEAIELAKEFGAEGGYRFVNGVLDKVAEQLRATGA